MTKQGKLKKRDGETSTHFISEKISNIGNGGKRGAEEVLDKSSTLCRGDGDSFGSRAAHFLLQKHG